MAQLDPEGIRARVREARRAAGLTQQELADALEVHKRTVENYERFRVPDFKMLNRIARVTNRDLEWFLHGEATEHEDQLADLQEQVSDLRRQMGEALELLRLLQEAPEQHPGSP